MWYNIDGNEQNTKFWTNQKQLIAQELKKNKQRICSALEIIQALQIQETKDAVIEFINNTDNEQLLVMATGIAQCLNISNNLDFTLLENKISDNTLKAIFKSYSLN